MRRKGFGLRAAEHASRPVHALFGCVGVHGCERLHCPRSPADFRMQFRQRNFETHTGKPSNNASAKPHRNGLFNLGIDWVPGAWLLFMFHAVHIVRHGGLRSEVVDGRRELQQVLG